jgi:hypothetical protein
MLHQTQAYLSPEQQVWKAVTGFGGPADCNAFLYCEMVEDHDRPKDVVLVKKGNFATQPSTPTSNDQVDGSLVVGSHIFLGRYLLPHLQKMAQASEIHQNGGAFGDGGLIAYAPKSLGYDPEHTSFTDPVFQFVDQNPNRDPNKLSSYRFYKQNSPQDKFKEQDTTICRISVAGTYAP